MSVTTRADEIIEQVQDKITETLRDVSEAVKDIVIDGCWGSDEISANRKQALVRAQTRLIEIRDELGT